MDTVLLEKQICGDPLTVTLTILFLSLSLPSLTLTCVESSTMEEVKKHESHDQHVTRMNGTISSSSGDRGGSSQASSSSPNYSSPEVLVSMVTGTAEREDSSKDLIAKWKKLLGTDYEIEVSQLYQSTL